VSGLPDFVKKVPKTCRSKSGTFLAGLYYGGFGLPNIRFGLLRCIELHLQTMLLQHMLKVLARYFFGGF
jgi:hypothetical protein